MNIKHTNKCKSCGSEYTPTGNTQIYCQECRSVVTKLCACGCGKEMKTIKYQDRKYINGHNSYGRKMTEFNKKMLNQHRNIQLQADRITKINKARKGQKLESIYGNDRASDIKSKQSVARGGTGIPYELFEYGPEFNRRLKEEIRTRDGHKCQLCGAPQEEQDKALHVHHIDYNKKNCSEVNLITLCNGCNVKANFNRPYWTEYFTKLMISKIQF